MTMNGHHEMSANGTAKGYGTSTTPSTPPGHLHGCYATLITKAKYLQGFVVLHDSFLRADARAFDKHPFVVLVTPALPRGCVRLLERLQGVKVKEVQSVQVDGHEVDAHDARFADTWTKLRGFELDEYERVVMMDCDMIVFRPMDELFSTEYLPLERDWIAAGPACTCNPMKLKHYPRDWVPDNCAYTPMMHPSCLTEPTPVTPDSRPTYHKLNSGLFVFTPSHDTMHQLIHFLATDPRVITYGFPDQDALADFFRGRYKPLPWCYNALKTLRRIHKPMWRDEEIRCIHYILDKPWEARPERGNWPVTQDLYAEEHKWWWTRYEEVIERLKQEGGEDWKLVDEHVAH